MEQVQAGLPEVSDWVSGQCQILAEDGESANGEYDFMALVHNCRSYNLFSKAWGFKFCIYYYHCTRKCHHLDLENTNGNFHSAESGPQLRPDGNELQYICFVGLC